MKKRSKAAPNREALHDLLTWWSKMAGTLDRMYQDVATIRRESNRAGSPLHPMFVHLDMHELEEAIAQCSMHMSSSYPMIQTDDSEVEKIIARL